MKPSLSLSKLFKDLFCGDKPESSAASLTKRNARFPAESTEWSQRAEANPIRVGDVLACAAKMGTSRRCR